MGKLVVRPVTSSYDPGYPRFTELDDWSILLKTPGARPPGPGALFAGLLGGCVFVSACQAADPPARLGPPLKSPNAKAAAIANAALAEVSAKAAWYSTSGQAREPLVRGQPAPRIPQIRISFGNSYVGIFDLGRARRATSEMFAAYGVKLEPKYRFQREGIEFEADGYDPAKKIGYDILHAEDPDPWAPSEGSTTHPPPEQVLDDGEKAKLEAAIASGNESFFLTNGRSYPNMDGDQYTALRAYLQSALEYLDWLDKQGKLK